MKIKIILLPLMALLLIAGGCGKNPATSGQEDSKEQGPINSEIKPAMISPDPLPQIDMGNWKVLSKTVFSMNYPPFLKLSDKSVGKTLDIAFDDTSLKGKIAYTQIKSDEKFVLPVTKINITLDRQNGVLEILDSGADLNRVVKASVTSKSGEELYFEFIFPKSEQDQIQTLKMLETVRLMLNSVRFK